ncbi:PREDICTED: rab escort protein 1 isoform X3 [Ipomoea nil]|uniref:rab escort protein 1 isoform X3 n=1 Tax=Ipomoea nil TaxID=35883 RepID=UPI0009010A90|nr:PREDICTED: rab escort protein 1 isoform X3 [Ipomoea nil]
MDDPTSYPPIEPSNFDLIVIGTGLPESIVAAAASAAGKSVLHLDSNSFYGSHYASLPLNDFTSFLHSHSNSASTPAPSQPDDESGFDRVPLCTRPVYSSIDVSAHSTEPLEHSQKFCIDLAGPRVLLCADAMINLILKTDINQYMEFKSVDAIFIYDGDGNLANVPDSRSAIFKDRSLSFPEKNQLMRFFKLVQGHLGGDDTQSNKISEEDLESPFYEFLNRMGLSSKLKSIILYAITMATYDQENVDACKDVLKTRDGINRLALYHSSVGRFSNAPGAMIYPIYGQGELSQAFCRRAAVKGCIYVLRMPVHFLLKDKSSGNYKGVKLASGQELFSDNLILAPSFVIPSAMVDSSAHCLQDDSFDFGREDVKEKLVKGICITKCSLRPDVANCLAFFPPRSLFPDQVTSIRVFQLSSNVAVCPSGMFVTYLSVICDDVVQGKKLLEAAINALFSIPVSGVSENNSADNPNSNTKPDLLWSALYVQELTKDSFDSFISVSMPDWKLHYSDLLSASMKIFQKIYPNEEFFPKAASTEKQRDDGVSELEPSAEDVPELKPSADGVPVDGGVPESEPEPKPLADGVAELEPSADGVAELEPSADGVPELKSSAEGDPVGM